MNHQTLRALIGLTAVITLTTTTTTACSLSPYPSGRIGCTPGGAPCPDGYACLDPQRAGQNTCVLIGCGDGQVDSATGEQCDDANDNDLDLCIGCQLQSYAVDPAAVVGFGPGIADPRRTPIGRPSVVTGAADGTIFIGSLGTNVITRVELSSSQPRLTGFAGNGSLVSVESTEARPPNEVSTVFSSSLALDGLGNLFIADLQPSVVRRIDGVTGAAVTVAGNETRAAGGDDVVGNQSSVNLPNSLAVDGDGTLFFVETDALGAKRVRRLDRVTGRLTTVLDGALPGTPDSLAFDDAGALHIFTADAARSVEEAPGTFVINRFIAVAKVRFDGAAPVLPLRVLEVPVSVERVVFEVDTAGDVVRDDAGIGIVRSRQLLEQTACATPTSAQAPFALRADGRRAFFASGQRFFQVELPENGRSDEAVCTLLGEAPLSVDAGSAFSLEPSDVAVAGDDVFFADPGNGVVWRVLPDQEQQAPVVVAGVLRTPGPDAFEQLVNEIVLEFAKQTDGHLGVGATDVCNQTGELDLSSFEFFAVFPELHRVVLSECTNRVTILAGTGAAGFDGDGGPAIGARLSRPAAAARGADGHIYIADRDNDRIRRVLAAPIDEDAIIETFVGPQGTATGDAQALRLDRPSGLAIDEDGGLLVSDSRTHRVLRIDTATGDVVTVLGTGVRGHNGDALPAAETQLDEPSSLVFLPFALLEAQLEVVPPGGLLVVAERGGHRIRATILPPIRGFPEVLTLAGDGVAGDDDDVDDGKNARLFHPRGLMLAPPSADLSALGFFIVDAVDRVRSMTLSADFGAAGFVIQTSVVTVTTRLDDVGAASRDDGDRDDALFRSPSALAVLDEDRVVVVDRLTGRLRLVTTSSATVRTVSGMPDGLDASQIPVPAVEAAPLRQPAGVALDVGVDPPALFVSESGSGQLRRFVLVDPNDPASWTTDAVALDVTLARPAGLAVDEVNRLLYVVDQSGQAVYAVDLDTIDDPISSSAVVVGVPSRRGATGDGGPALGALLNEPEGVALLDEGRVLLVADTGNNRVRRVSLDDGVIVTVLGDGSAASGGEGAPARAFPVQRPRGLAVDARGNLLVTSTNALRFVQAGDDGVPDGDDDVRTVYGKPPRQVFPEAVTRCLSDVALAPAKAGAAPAVFVVDACLGVLLRLDRH